MLSLKASRTEMKKHGFGSLVTLPNGNTKLSKSVGYFNAGISLAQASLSGHNMCAGSTEQCRAACLGGTGRAEYLSAIVVSRINRTKLYATNPALFWELLEPELHMVDRMAKRLGIRVAFRPNILSDQPWHIKFPQMFENFAHWQFYGYTKVKSNISAMLNRSLPPNMYFVYSWSERACLDYAKELVENGVNVAVPFYCKETLRPAMPQRWHHRWVEDGDKHDLRFLDPPKRIVGLKVKLPKRRDLAVKKINESNGFFVGV